MRHSPAVVTLLALAACGAHIDQGGGGSDGSASVDGGTDLAGLAGGIVVEPGDVTLALGASQAFKARAGAQDVTGAATWIVDDQSLGKMQGSTFVAGNAHGGTTQVHAVYAGAQGAATLHVRVAATITTGCPGCPKLPDPPGKSCGAGTEPQLVYPPDGVLLPPNMNVLEVQWKPGASTKTYEVDFESAGTDVRVLVPCNAITDTRKQATGGCAYDLDAMVWGLLAGSNRGTAPVVVTVRGTTDGSCASTSNPRSVLFAEEDLHGGIYYWQSLVVGGVAGKTGGIYRYDFGNPAKQGEAFLTPQTGSCVGCHFLSRDGRRMTYGTDDADSDDEYADLSGHLLDVGAKKVVATTSPSGGKPLPPGFQTFTHDHRRLLATLGETGSATTLAAYDGEAGGKPLAMPSTGMRGTQPDWSADDKSVVFVVPAKFASGFQPKPYKRPDDDHFIGGSLWTIAYDTGAGSFGPPKQLLQSGGENNYYPSYSPDSPPSFVVFNRADAPELSTDLAKDAFNNPSARVFVLSTKAGALPVEAKRANGDAMSTNSWPRWSPFVQTYHGQRLLWVTFSSTRDYGLKVRNHVPVNGQAQVNCYPPDSPQNPTGSHSQPLPPNCNQPQIWMAAINLAKAEFGTDDPSYPAFWLPFQEVTAHNHIAQWTEEVVTKPGCADGGTSMCIQETLPCGMKDQCGVCCSGMVCQMGTCQKIIGSPPPAADCGRRCRASVGLRPRSLGHGQEHEPAPSLAAGALDGCSGLDALATASD